MNKLASAALLVLSIGLAACSAAPAASPTPSPKPATPAPSTPAPATPAPGTTVPATPAPTGLDGRQFIVTKITDDGADHPVVPGTTVRLTFADGNLSAHAGCNSMSGQYSLDGTTLKVGPMATTEIGCQPALQAQDQWLAAFLASEPTLVLAGDTLTLTSGTTVMTLLDKEVAEPDQPLANRTWGLVSIITGDAVSSVPAGITASLLFKDDGTFEMHNGCNSGGGKYTVDGDQISFSDVIQTEMACAGAGGQVEQSFLKVITAESVTYAIDGTSLTLLADSDGLQFQAAMDL